MEKHLRGDNRTSRALATGLISVLFATVIVTATGAPAAASSCSDVMWHLNLAKASLQEADVYREEDNEDMAKVNASNANHELDMAEHVGDPVSCVNDAGYSWYLSLQAHNDYLAWIYHWAPSGLSSSDLARTLSITRDDLKGIKQSANPSAYASIKRDIASLESLYKYMKQAEQPETSPQSTPPTASSTRASCSDPTMPATLVSGPAPITPDIAKQQGITGYVRVDVSLDANGHVRSTPTVRESTSTLLNSAAIEAAMQSTFKAASFECKSVPSNFLYLANFQ